MDSLSHILCVSCYGPVGKDQDVLLCGSCQLWQHRECKTGVSESFYRDFYLAVIQNEKPESWICHYCTKHGTRVKPEPKSPPHEKALDLSILKMPPPPPPSSVHSQQDDSMDSDSSFDEFNFAMETERGAREGPASYLATSMMSLDEYSPHAGRKVLIPAKQIVSDLSFQPTLYALYQTAHGDTEVEDSYGNKFKLTQHVFYQAENNDITEVFQCDKASCGFQVRVCPVVSRFLTGTPGSHTHDSVSPQDTDAEMAISADDTQNRSSSTAGSRAWQTDDSDDSDDSDDVCSPTIPSTTATPFHTPCGKSYAGARDSLESYCSDTTDDEVSTPPPVSIQRFQSLTSPAQSRLCLNVSFTSSSDTPDNEDLNLTALCNHLSYMSESSDASDNEDHPAPSPTATLPYMHSSDSSDSSDSEEDDVSMATRYTITEGTMSGARTLLTDSLGNTYNIKFKLGLKMFWCCTEKSSRCSATIIQSRKDNFTRGVATHNHGSTQSQGRLPSSITTHNHGSDQSRGSLQSSVTTHNHSSDQSRGSLPSNITTHNHGSDQSQGNLPTSVSLTDSARALQSPLSKTTRQPQANKQTEYQELDTCIQDPRRPKSMLVDTDGYIYSRKTEHRPANCDHDITMWRCTHKGILGGCNAVVQIDYRTDFNTDPDRTTHFYGVNHDELVMAIKPHNHNGNIYAVGHVKIKTAIKENVFVGGGHNMPAKKVVETVYNSMLMRDKTNLLWTSDEITILSRFAYYQQKIYKNTSREELSKFFVG